MPVLVALIALASLTSGISRAGTRACYELYDQMATFYGLGTSSESAADVHVRTDSAAIDLTLQRQNSSEALSLNQTKSNIISYQSARAYEPLLVFHLDEACRITHIARTNQFNVMEPLSRASMKVQDVFAFDHLYMKKSEDEARGTAHLYEMMKNVPENMRELYFSAQPVLNYLVHEAKR